MNKKGSPEHQYFMATLFKYMHAHLRIRLMTIWCIYAPQLLHVFSGKYVAINPVEISKTENINLEVLANLIYVHFLLLFPYKPLSQWS